MFLQSIKLSRFKAVVEPSMIFFPSQVAAMVGSDGNGIIAAVSRVLGVNSMEALRGNSRSDLSFIAMFSASGCLGHNSYAIIGQNMLNPSIAATPETLCAYVATAGLVKYTTQRHPILTPILKQQVKGQCSTIAWQLAINSTATICTSLCKAFYKQLKASLQSLLPVTLSDSYAKLALNAGNAIYLLSSGDTTLMAIALTFVICLLKPAPFALLDAGDAALAAKTQVIFISHNKLAIAMHEPGASFVIAVASQEDAN